jgi:hypothetical protein
LSHAATLTSSKVTLQTDQVFQQDKI